MPFVPVENTALVEIRMLSQGQQVENTLWFELATEIDSVSLGALLDAVHLWWSSDIAPLTSSRVEVTEYVGTDQTTATAIQVSLPGDVTDVGGNTPNAMPLGTTFVVSFRTNLRGRSFRGRNYVVGLTEDQVDGNSLEAGVGELWRAAYENLIGVAAGVDWSWVVASRFSGVSGSPPTPTPRVAGLTTPVTSVVVVDDFIDSQRRRLSGRGR